MDALVGDAPAVFGKRVFAGREMQNSVLLLEGIHHCAMGIFAVAKETDICVTGCIGIFHIFKRPIGFAAFSFMCLHVVLLQGHIFISI